MRRRISPAMPQEACSWGQSLQPLLLYSEQLLWQAPA